MPDKEMTKICGICGDKAIGYYNFNAITCDSCKAFFRRNANKLNQFKCYFDGNCKIDLSTRKLCKKCRLTKCFVIGMKKEWILSEEERLWRNYKIQVNRKKRQNKLQKKNVKTDPDQPNHTELLVNDCDSSNERTRGDESQLQAQALDGQLVQYSSDRSGLNSGVVSCGRPLTDYNNNLHEIEGFKLTELLSSMTLMSDHNHYRNVIKDPIIERACMAWATKCQDETHKIIKMSKCLRGFLSLCDNDQLALIKYGSVEVYILRLITQYNFERRYFRLVNGQNCLIMKMDLLRDTRKFLFDAYELFVNIIGPQWDFDDYVIYMLTPIILFNPDRPNLCNREEIRQQQNIYKYLLHRYLLLRFRSEYEATTKFNRLMDILSVGTQLMLAHKWGYQRKDPNSVLPLMKELFDLRFAEHYITDWYSENRFSPAIALSSTNSEQSD